MEFIFHPSSYDASGLEAEAANLLQQRLEAYSRQVVPGVWHITDKLNAHTAKRPEKRRRRCRIYGALLIALGVFALVPGLMEPRVPALIGAGGLAMIVGVLNLFLPRKKKAPVSSGSCRREAAELLRPYREADWEALDAEIRFDEGGMTVTVQGEPSFFGYDTFRAAFESERLWLVVYDDRLSHLLQKKDLVSGEAAAFLPCLQEKISENLGII